MIPFTKRFDIFSPCVGCSEGLDAFIFFFEKYIQSMQLHLANDVFYKYVKFSQNFIFLIGMAISPNGGVFSYLPHHLDLAFEDSVGHKQYMHECVGASQGYHGVYRAAQTVLSRCCHG